MIFKTNFIPYTTDRDLWRNISLISVVLYIILVFTNFIEWDNFFFLSILVGVQLYFWLGQQKEIYRFSPHQLHIQFLWFKKSITFDSYTVIVQSSKNRKDYNNLIEFQQIQLFDQNRKVYSFNQYHNPYLFEELVGYLEQHSNSTDYNYPSNEKFETKGHLLVYLFICITVFIFSVGFNFEQYYIPQANTLKEIQGKMVYSPDEYIHESKKNKTYQYRIFIKGYNKMFVVHTRDYPNVKREKLLSAKNYITLFVDANEMDYAHHLITQPYFSSHFINRDMVTIKKIKYLNEFLLDANLEEPDHSFFNLIIIITPLFGIGHSLYRLNSLYS
ncbi:hypothetical protein [Faecalibacter sp. LW9]|uniref:hypothetical protein n=1 Tax=Faecalibacter sp. LW9 TaxID=3103144 RepID=UPI002AFEEEBD|nr:hypothetical protein [Faecalibacter sp. LW9]